MIHKIKCEKCELEYDYQLDTDIVFNTECIRCAFCNHKILTTWRNEMCWKYGKEGNIFCDGGLNCDELYPGLYIHYCGTHGNPEDSST